MIGRTSMTLVNSTQVYNGSPPLGINLTAADVADAILAAVDAPAFRRRIHQVHFPVGLQTKVMAPVSRFLPAWLSRALNKRLARF